jgi:hypothetical protein
MLNLLGMTTVRLSATAIGRGLKLLESDSTTGGANKNKNKNYSFI